MKIGAGYFDRQSAKDHDVPFAPGDAKGDNEIVFKKRPFGILGYQAGKDGKGAMVMNVIPKSRYPGDPQGQAFAAGVQRGWVVKSINGQDVQNEDFGTIMDLLDDEIMDQRFFPAFLQCLEDGGTQSRAGGDADDRGLRINPRLRWKVPRNQGGHLGGLCHVRRSASDSWYVEYRFLTFKRFLHNMREHAPCLVAAI